MGDFLIKSVVYPFYKAYLGFFILMVVVLGVFMELKQHVMIAKKVLENNHWFLGIMLAFVIYSIFQFRFQRKLLLNHKYQIFQKLSFLPFSAFSKHFLPVWASNHALLILYSILLSVVCFQIHSWPKLILVWGILAISLILSVFYTYQTLKGFYPEKLISRTRLIKVKPFFLWFPTHLKENRPLLLLGIKAFCLFLMSGFFYSYFLGGYDSRWLAFGLLVCAFINYPILLEKLEFTENQLYYFRNLPLSYAKKILREFLIFMILISPEILLLIYQGSALENRMDQFNLISFWMGLNFGLYALILFVKENPNPTLFIISFFSLFLAIIFGINLLLLAIGLFLIFGISIRSPYQI